MKQNNFTFFLLIPPHFEKLALLELEEKLQLFFPDFEIATLQIIHGGIELELPLNIGCNLNKVLKIPTRILLRLESFKCRDFPKLFNKIAKLNWRDFLIGQIPDIRSTSINSRLFDSRRIEKTIQDALIKYYKANAPKKKDVKGALGISPGNIYIRFENDLCTISLDTTGERLNIRGYRSFSSQAPIRENLAAALIYNLKQHLKNCNNVELVDPMCGAGTFLLESFLFFRPQHLRDYSYRCFPIAGPDIESDFRVPDLAIAEKFGGYDCDESVIAAAKKNLDLAQIPKDLISFTANNLFDQKQIVSPHSNRIVVTNPPYGKRIRLSEDSNEVGSNNYYHKIISRIIELYSPKLIGMVIPREIKFSPVHPQHNIIIKDKLYFSNGGFKVCFYILETVTKIN